MCHHQTKTRHFKSTKMWNLLASYKFYMSGLAVYIVTGITKECYKTSILKYSTWSIWLPEQLWPVAYIKYISCTINVKYLTKQRCKKRSGAGRHHLLERCNAITGERSRTLTVHSSFLKHNDTNYKCCYIPVIKSDKAAFLSPFKMTRCRNFNLREEPVSSFLTPDNAQQRQRDIPQHEFHSITTSTL